MDIVLQVDSDFLLVLSALFSSAWKIITSFHIPGTNINVAEFSFACMMVVFVIKVVPAILGFRSPWGTFISDVGGGHPKNVNDGNDKGVGRW